MLQDAEGETVEVIGSTGNRYFVSYENGRPQSCTCADHTYRRRACKHMGRRVDPPRRTQRSGSPPEGLTDYGARQLRESGFVMLGLGVVLGAFVPVAGAVFIALGVLMLLVTGDLQRGVKRIWQRLRDSVR
jgi:hypothetical protein